ncbi:MAG: hypothetical protein O7G88_03740 [bacterium]|nr:hypothetical protein [bacterium]
MTTALLKSKLNWTLAGMALAGLTLFATPAVFAQNSKTAVGISAVMSLGSATDTLDLAASSNWSTIIRSYIRVATWDDLAFDVALQCGMVTDTTVKSHGGNKGSSTAEGDIKVRVRVAAVDADSNPVGNWIYADPNADVVNLDGNEISSAANSGVTYCSRSQTLEARFAGLNCWVDDLGFVTCTDDESVRLLLKTLSAHAFNFFVTDLKSGEYVVEVQAVADTTTDVGCTGDGCSLGEASAHAFIGLGTMHIDEIRLLKNTVLMQ